VPLLFSPNHTRVGAAPDFRRPANPVRERTIKLDEGPAETGSLEPVMNFPTSGAGSQFFSDRGARSDEYGVSSSDKGRRNEENWPQPSGFHPNAQSSRAGDPGLRRKSGHTSLSSSTVVPPQSSDSASSPPHGRRPVRGGPGSGPIFVRNAARAKVHNRL